MKIETYEVLANYTDTWGPPRWNSANYWSFFRLDLELVIYFYDEGPILSEIHCRNGYLHRPLTEGPAYQKFNRAGRITYIEHWVNGVKHDLR